MQDVLACIVQRAPQFLGPVRLVSKADCTCDYAQFNDDALRKILEQSGWKGQRIAYVSTYASNYTRTETLLACLERIGVPVDVFISPRRYVHALCNLWRIRRTHDIVIIGFRGHEILPFARIILGRNIRIIFDAFVSVYDTLCHDRQVCRPDSIGGVFLRWYDKWLSTLATVTIVDTRAHAEYFRSLGCVRIAHLYVDCNRKLFSRCPVPRDPSHFTIFWYGNCLPLHGVENIVRFAASMKDVEVIHFHLVGPIRATYGDIVDELHLSNCTFTDWIPYEQLAMEMSRADLCLGGHFHNSPKAQRVIPGKTYQMLECCNRVLIADNAAHREIFATGTEVEDKAPLVAYATL